MYLYTDFDQQLINQRVAQFRDQTERYLAGKLTEDEYRPLRSHLITDYLEVRMKAIFEELVINKTSTIGGKEIISPAGGVVAHKVEEVTVTYNNVSQKAYRCYFLAEQEGNAVDNDFAVGDQVRSESFNVRKGTYHKAGNHFYWRLVIGRDEDPVELEKQISKIYGEM
jgi:hypothetical protein